MATMEDKYLKVPEISFSPVDNADINLKLSPSEDLGRRGSGSLLIRRLFTGKIGGYNKRRES